MASKPLSLAQCTATRRRSLRAPVCSKQPAAARQRQAVPSLEVHAHVRACYARPVHAREGVSPLHCTFGSL